MPAYEYLCKQCSHRFDVRQKMSDAAIDVCPECGGKVVRLISGGAGAITKSSSALPICGSGGGCPAAQPGGGCGMGGGCGHAH